MRVQLLWLAGIVVLVIGLFQLLKIGSWEEFMLRFGSRPRAALVKKRSTEEADTARNKEDAR